jgi:hypothetical protein
MKYDKGRIFVLIFVAILVLRFVFYDRLNLKLKQLDIGILSQLNSFVLYYILGSAVVLYLLFNFFKEAHYNKVLVALIVLNSVILAGHLYIIFIL